MPVAQSCEGIFSTMVPTSLVTLVCVTLLVHVLSTGWEVGTQPFCCWKLGNPIHCLWAVSTPCPLFCIQSPLIIQFHMSIVPSGSPDRCCSPSSLPCTPYQTSHSGHSLKLSPLCVPHHQWNRSSRGDGDFSCLMPHVTGTVQTHVHTPSLHAQTWGEPTNAGKVCP